MEHGDIAQKWCPCKAETVEAYKGRLSLGANIRKSFLDPANRCKLLQPNRFNAERDKLDQI